MDRWMVFNFITVNRTALEQCTYVYNDDDDDIGEYISLEMFYFVSLTRGSSLIPFITMN